MELEATHQSGLRGCRAGGLPIQVQAPRTHRGHVFGTHLAGNGADRVLDTSYVCFAVASGVLYPRFKKVFHSCTRRLSLFLRINVSAFSFIFNIFVKSTNCRSRGSFIRGQPLVQFSR